MEHLTLARKLIGAVGVVVAALFIAFFRDLKNIIGKIFFAKSVLVIGILSSPENFDSREGIRETWLNFTSDFSIVHHFVIGKHLCRVHPLDRVSPYSCVENRLSLPENVTSEAEFSVLSRREEEKEKAPQSGKVSATGFGFETLRGITVNKLGVLRHVLTHVSYLRVKLRSSYTLTTLASVTITGESTPADGSDFVMKSIKPVSLPQNTETQLILELEANVEGFLPHCGDLQWNFAPGVVNYLQLIQYGERKPWPFTSVSCSYVSMNYTITDVGSVRRDLLKAREREKEWRERTQVISRRLKTESDYYGDLMFVDVVDVYRNLPKKLIQFFKRLADTELFYYVLKTDDDSFIDVERVYTHLELKNNEVSGLNNRKLWWWSKYREFWKVQETGKWRDDDYRSAGYPPFPCGGGYVLSEEIVNYLVQNEEHLQFFQGEDVSVGIWLSALKTVPHRTRNFPVSDVNGSIQERIVKNFRGERDWLNYLKLSDGKLFPDSCEWTCEEEEISHVPRCNRVQLNPAEMYAVWDRYIRQGFA